MKKVPELYALGIIIVGILIGLPIFFILSGGGLSISDEGLISIQVFRTPKVYAQEAGVELVDLRTRNSKTFTIEAGFALDVSIGAVHYDNGGKWEDIDTTLAPAEAPWDWKMEEAGYQAYFVEQFLSDMIVRFEKAEEWIEFQPEALQWYNDWQDLQIISMPTEVTGVVTDNTIHWADAYGLGLDFQWETQNTRLAKLLIIDDWATLPAPEPYMLEGPNLVLDLNLVFSFSSGVQAYIMDEVWDESDQQFHDFVEFRDTDTGEILWAFIPLKAWGSGDILEGDMPLDIKLNTQGSGPSKKLYLHVVTPYDWLESATYPIYIDTTVDEQVGASTDDTAVDDEDATHPPYNTLIITSDYCLAGRYDPSYRGSGMRFQTVAIPNAATIDVAYMTFTANGDYSGTIVNTELEGEDIDDSATFSDIANFNARIRTSATVNWDSIGAWTNNTEYNTPSITTIVKEIVDRGGWATGNNMTLFWDDDISTSSTAVRGGYSYDGSTTKCVKLHVEYTTVAASITSAPATYGFGTVGTSSTTSTGLDYFNVTNDGSGAVNITIHSDNWTGGINWTLSDTATPGSDTVGLRAGLDGGGYTIIVKKTAPYNDLVTNLAESGSQLWGLQLLAPTVFSDGVLKESTVTLTASAS